MARNYKMTWDGKRWLKKVPVELRGVAGKTTVSVSPKQLGTGPTKQESWRAANQWWDENEGSWRASLRERKRPGSPAAVRSLLEAWKGGPLEDEIEAAAVIADIMGFYQDKPLPEAVAKMLMGTVEFDWIQETLERATEGPPRTESGLTLQQHLDRFLEVQDCKPGSLDNLKRNLGHFVNFLGPARLVLDVVSAETFEGYYLELKKLVQERRQRGKPHGMTPDTADGRMIAARRFIRHLWSKDLVELPKNLDSREYSFKKHKKVDVPKLEAAIEFLGQMSGRVQLYSLLMLNCSMNQIDIAGLTHDQVDWEVGTLVRKRVKTEDSDRVPTVTYKLWPVTLGLLKKYRSDDPSLVLVSSKGTKLVDRFYDPDGNSKRKDNIYQEWKRSVGVAITPKQLRSLGASLLENHKYYGRCSRYYLCHAPRLVADKHYIDPPQEFFDEALAWLGGKFGFDGVVPEES